MADETRIDRMIVELGAIGRIHIADELRRLEAENAKWRWARW